MIDFSGLFEGRDGCPSDHTLDAYEAEVLEPEARVSFERHHASCLVCQARMATVTAGFAAFPQLDERKVLAAVRMGEVSVIPWWRRWQLALVPVLAAAAAVVFMVMPGDKRGKEPVLNSGNRLKGDLALRVFRAGTTGSEELLSGAQFSAGDRLQFIAEIPDAGQVQVVGVEADGTVYRAWPLVRGTPTHMKAGKHRLPGAVALDDSPSDETLYLVFCPGLNVPKCVSMGRGKAPRCDEGCRLRAFRIHR